MIVDERVVDYSRSEMEEDELEEILEQSTRRAVVALICKIFSFTELIAYTEQLLPDILKRKTGPKEKNIALHEKIVRVY